MVYSYSIYVKVSFLGRDLFSGSIESILGKTEQQTFLNIHFATFSINFAMNLYSVY